MVWFGQILLYFNYCHPILMILAYPRPHDVGEVGMMPEHGAVDGDHHVVIVHLLEQGGDAGRGHESRSPGDTLADVPDSGAVLISDTVQSQLLQHSPALGVVSHWISLDDGDILAVEDSLLKQPVHSHTHTVAGLVVYEDELLHHHVYQHLPHQLPHVHPADHLLEYLSPRIQTHLIHCEIPFCTNKVQLALISKINFMNFFEGISPV